MWKMMASTSALQRQLLLWGILDLGIWQILSLTSLPVSRSGSFVRLLSELLSKPLSSADGPNHWLPQLSDPHLLPQPPSLSRTIIAIIKDLITFNLDQTCIVIVAIIFIWYKLLKMFLHIVEGGLFWQREASLRLFRLSLTHSHDIHMIVIIDPKYHHYRPLWRPPDIQALALPSLLPRPARLN